MSYTLNDSEILLLAHIAGGFNYNRVGILPADRFSASVKWANADALNALVEAATAVVAPPTGDVDVIGGPIGAFETRSYIGSPGKVYALQAGADGKFSVEISGSPWTTFSTGEKGIFDPARTMNGGATGTPQAVKAGEWCNWKYDAVSGGQTMRPQLL